MQNPFGLKMGHFQFCLADIYILGDLLSELRGAAMLQVNNLEASRSRSSSIQVKNNQNVSKYLIFTASS